MTVHQCPPEGVAVGGGVMPCCGRSPFDAPRTDRITLDPADVTCGRSDRQTWERRVGGTDIAATRLHLDIDPEGRARVHEAVLAQLLVDAGWERTA